MYKAFSFSTQVNGSVGLSIKYNSLSGITFFSVFTMSISSISHILSSLAILIISFKESRGDWKVLVEVF